VELRIHAVLGEHHRVAQVRVRGGAGPTDRQAKRDGTRFEPEIAGLAYALDVVDGLDLTRLGQEDPEPRRAQAREVVGAAGIPAEGVGNGREDAIAGQVPEPRDQPLEPVELEDDDGGRPTVAVDSTRYRSAAMRTMSSCRRRLSARSNEVL